VHKGIRNRLLDIILFAGGIGLPGWLKIGAPEVWIPNVQEDSRCPREEALKLRIGSFAMLPIQYGDEPYGYLVAATNRSGGVDVSEIELLRAVASELSQAIARLEHDDILASGIATAAEFQAAIELGGGHLVQLQPLRKELLLEQFGKPALDRAFRTLVRKLRARLPSGSLVFRRDDGDFLVYLRSVPAEFAVNWANEVSAIASMIGVSDAKGSRRIPLPMRAKVAANVALDRVESAEAVA
jgi:GAF domain-containing protein